MPYRSKNQPTNTLRLNEQELHRLLTAYEQQEESNSATDREFVRWSYRVEAVNLVIENSPGNRVTLPVATRNISRGGISILHSSYIHSGTQCQILLKIPDGTIQSVSGTVRRCAHVTGRVHEIGIEFDEQISTKDLLGLDPLNEAYSLERIDPKRLIGSVLIVTPSEMDRDIFLMYLDGTNLSTHTTDSLEKGIERAKRGTDIILCDYHIGEHTALEFLDALREAECHCPVLVLTSDKSEGVLSSIRSSNAMGILTKPVSRGRILQALAEFLHAEGDGGPLYTNLIVDDPAYPLLNKFLAGITRLTLNLEKASRENDLPRCLSLVRSLSGTAEPLDFPEISDLALAAENTLTRSGVRPAHADIRSLIVACRRIKSRPAV